MCLVVSFQRGIVLGGMTLNMLAIPQLTISQFSAT
jgi:hypothetical protein